MNYLELQGAILGDTHREDYAPYVARFIAFAEAYIAARVESYPLTYQFTDTDRVAVNDPLYILPARVTLIRHVLVNREPLNPMDETTAAQYRSVNQCIGYTVRPLHLLITGTPGPGTLIDLNYFGLPPPLVSDTDTHALLNDYPQLYTDAASVYVFRRAQDYESATAAFTSANGIIDEINRKMKKLLGGAPSGNPYNVSHRSSY